VQALTNPEKEKACQIILHAINWMRELLNQFATQVRLGFFEILQWLNANLNQIWKTTRHAAATFHQIFKSP
jgi:hypothetical protein